MVMSFLKDGGLGTGLNSGYLLAWYIRNSTARMTTAATISQELMIAKLLISNYIQS
jgi:hypothetical protein